MILIRSIPLRPEPTWQRASSMRPSMAKAPKVFLVRSPGWRTTKPVNCRLSHGKRFKPPKRNRQAFMTADRRILSDQFPRSSKYHPEWVVANASGGANSLWLTEWLAEKLDLQPGMRVLDLGCGRASSSIFLRREFGVQVWATDLWFSAAENIQRVRDAGVDDGVFPLHVDARSLPFAPDSSTPSCALTPTRISEPTTCT